MSTPSTSTGATNIPYFSQGEAYLLSQDLEGANYGFTIPQILELDGLGVAQAVYKCYPVDRFNRVIVCCGPANNGAEGLICSRHLRMFGYSVQVIRPYAHAYIGAQLNLFQSLLAQADASDVPCYYEWDPETMDQTCDLIVDAVFGYSWNPPNRSVGYAKLLNAMQTASLSFGIPICSVDIPSGWDVDSGYATMKHSQRNIDKKEVLPVLQPDCLISLTVPKKCASFFTGRYHYLAGRICPEELVVRYRLNRLPPYPDCQNVVALKHDE